jgi:imidazolonepropionase-like amidohydrolase
MRFSPRRALSALLFIFAFTTAGAARAQQSGTVILRGGWLFDGVRNDRVRNPGIVVHGGTIVRIGTPTAAENAAATFVDVTDDETILPGLIDVHGHYSMSLVGRRRDEVGVYAQVYLANGVTATFSGGDFNPEEMLALKDRIERGQQPGPRLFNAGPYYGNARVGVWNENMTAEELRADIDKWAALGVRSFKAKGISKRLLPVLLERAHWHGITVSGHLGSGFGDSVNPKDAVLMGIDRVDHFMGGDAMPATRQAYSSLEELDVNSQAVKDIFKLFIDHNVYYNTTLSTYGHVANPDEVFAYWFDEKSLLTPYVRSVHETDPPRPYSEQFRRIYNKKKEEIKAFFDAGGGHLITLATDAPSNGERFSGFNAHRELHALVKSGIPPAAALKIGTINGARALGVSDKQGSIEVSKYADLFIVRGNPLEDIRNTHNVRLVMRGGQVYDSKALLEAAKGKLGPASAAEAVANGWARSQASDQP